MTPNKLKLIAVITLVTLAVACTSPSGQTQLKTVSTQTQAVNVPLPADATKPTDLTIRLGAAEVVMGMGAARLADGTVQYNVSDLQPSVSTSGSKAEINQTVPKGTLPKDMVNKWNLRFSNAVPVNLSILAGTYNGTWELGGLRLQSLKWEEGVSHSKISFSAANPEKLDSFTFKTGASTIEMNNLGNLNFGTMSFQGEAGSYKLNFGGKLKQSATVEIKTAASTLEVVVPVGTTAIINLNSKVSNIKTVGSWTTSGTTYTTGKEDAAAKLTVNIDIGAGQLTLDTH
jgi:N-terminal domain of toast_rack, DUF2154